MSGGTFGEMAGAYGRLRRSVIDDVTGRPVVTSAPTGEVVQRSSVLPLGRDDSGRVVPALPSIFTGAVEAATYPGRVMRGEASVFDPSTGHVGDEAIGKASDIAGLAMTGSLPLSAPAGALRMFGGRNAATADRKGLLTAEVARNLGLSRDATFRETGWVHGPDGTPRFEISDDGARLTGAQFEPTGEKVTGLTMYRPRPLSEVMDHPDLYRAYPDMANVQVKHAMDYGPGGEYAAPDGPGDLGTIRLETTHPDTLSTLLHEVQHGIQHREGFASGGAPDQFDLGNRAANYDAYKRLGGEVEARNVQSRMGMTLAERRATPPMATQDIPDAQQILRSESAAPVPFGDALSSAYLRR